MTQTAAPRQSLLEKYRPRSIADFVGLDKPKLLLQRFTEQPYPCAFLFAGKPGIGKTAMGRVLAETIGAELHLLPAQKCKEANLAQLDAVQRTIGSVEAKWRILLVDEADTLTKTQQIRLRSRIDGPLRSPDQIWVFTATSTSHLDEGFTSRCMQVPFSTYGNSAEAVTFLEKVWRAESVNQPEEQPNYTRIVKEANGSIRTALNVLQDHLR